MDSFVTDNNQPTQHSLGRSNTLSFVKLSASSRGCAGTSCGALRVTTWPWVTVAATVFTHEQTPEIQSQVFLVLHNSFFVSQPALAAADPHPHSQGAAAAKGKRRKELVEEWMPTPKKSSTPKAASKAVATPSSGASKLTVALNSLTVHLSSLVHNTSRAIVSSHSLSLNNSPKTSCTYHHSLMICSIVCPLSLSTD